MPFTTWIEADVPRVDCATQGVKQLRGPSRASSSLDGVQWHTFAGGAVNRLLAAGLGAKSGTKWVAGNLSVRCSGLPVGAAGDAIRGLADLNWEHERQFCQPYCASTLHESSVEVPARRRRESTDLADSVRESHPDVTL
jgi:hypothetical protein